MVECFDMEKGAESERSRLAEPSLDPYAEIFLSGKGCFTIAAIVTLTAAMVLSRLQDHQVAPSNSPEPSPSPVALQTPLIPSKEQRSVEAQGNQRVRIVFQSQ